MDNLIARSRERFATPRRIVEDKLNRWIAPVDAGSGEADRGKVNMRQT
jgi:hypothetical protein